MIRIGNSFDIHKRKNSRPLIIGGIKISDTNGLDGHSDADILTHVICESIMGAIGISDLGDLFPDTDNKYKNISSIILLKEVLNIMKNKQYTIINIDTQLILNTPHINKYNKIIKNNLISVLEIDEEQLNIKATRSEDSITSINDNKAIFAFATCLLERKNNDKY